MLYDESRHEIAVPRYFPWDRYVTPGYREEFTAPEGTSCTFQMKTTLLKEPARDQEAAVSALYNAGHGILAAAPAKGKTIMGLALIQRMKRKALIAVPTTFLLEQWLERIEQHTSLTRRDVGILQGDKANFDAPIILGMLQTLAQRDYPADALNTIGVFLADEVHRFGAATWIHAISKFPAAHRFGLSATVERKDGMHRAFQYHMGNVRYTMLESDLTPNIMQVSTGVKMRPEETINVWNGEFNVSKAYNVLCAHKGRNLMLQEEIRRAYHAGRKVIALSRRIEQMEGMRSRLIAQGVPAEATGLLVGKVKPDARREILERCRVIFATEQIAGLGLDQPDLDTLVWLSPSQNVEQNIGRITRTHPSKKHPLVIDPVDLNGYFARLADSRRKKYSRFNWPCTTYNRAPAVEALHRSK